MAACPVQPYIVIQNTGDSGMKNLKSQTGTHFGLLTLSSSIQELSNFLLCLEHIWVTLLKTVPAQVDYIGRMGVGKINYYERLIGIIFYVCV